MSAQFFRGTQLSQNVKFKDKDQKLIKEWNWPAHFERIDLSKVELDVLAPWIQHRCTQLMGQNDEIVISYVASYME
jgi:serine/arginine repetitive matrix protein 1